jgi:hypothetical protein
MKKKSTYQWPRPSQPVKAKKPVNKALIIKIAIASALLVAVITTLLVVLFACKDNSPYADIDLSKHITVPKYFGRELSEKEVADAFAEDKQALIDAYSKYSDPIESGTITAGQNVTITIAAYKYDETKPGNLGDAVKDISINDYVIKNIQQIDTENEGEGEDEDEKKEDVYFPAMQNMLIGTKFDFTPGTSYQNTRILDYTYAEDYTLASLKGVRVIHIVYITKVTTTIVPELNDQFFLDNKEDLGYESYNEYETYMIHQIRLNLLWNKIVEEAKVKKFPSSYTDKYYAAYDADIKAYMSKNNITTMTALYSHLGMTEAEFNAERKEFAEGTVKEEMILYYIIEKEEIELTEKQYNDTLATLAADAGYESAEAYTKAFGEELTERTVVWEYLKQLILDKSVAVA